MSFVIAVKLLMTVGLFFGFGAIVGKNLIVSGLRGTVGGENGLTFKQDKLGRTVVSTKSNGPASFNTNQVAAQTAFREAVDYAKSVQTLEVYTNYSAANPQFPGGYHAAISDYRTPPVYARARQVLDGSLKSHEIDWSGSGTLVFELFINSITVDSINIRVFDAATSPIDEGGDVSATEIGSGSTATFAASPLDGTTSTWQFDLSAYLSSESHTPVSGHSIWLVLEYQDMPGNVGTVDPNLADDHSTFGDALAYLEAKLA